MKTKKLVIVTIIAFFIGAIIGLATGRNTSLLAFAEDYTDETTLVGDIDGDGQITISDAYLILVEYAERSVGVVNDVDDELYDVDGDGELSMTDAYLTMVAYATWSVGGGYEWPPLAEMTSSTSTINYYLDDFYPAGSTVQYVGTNKWCLRSTDLTYDVVDTIVGTIENGDTFIIKGTYEPCWLEVYFEGDEENIYWIYATSFVLFNVIDENTTSTTTTTDTTTTLTTTTTTTTTTATTTTEDATAYYSMGDIVEFSGISWNLRTSMSTSSDSNIADKVLNSEEFLILYHADDTTWYCVVFDSSVYYISLERDDLFTKTGEITTTSEEGYYELGDMVKFTGISWNLRTSMSTETSDNIADAVSTNEEFLIIQHCDSTWYQVVYNSQVYYISFERDDLFTKVGTLSNDGTVVAE